MNTCILPCAIGELNHKWKWTNLGTLLALIGVCTVGCCNYDTLACSLNSEQPIIIIRWTLIRNFLRSLLDMRFCGSSHLRAWVSYENGFSFLDSTKQSETYLKLDTSQQKLKMVRYLMSKKVLRKWVYLEIYIHL